ncbi:hypothetical protein [Tamilnaduibacter salinus]|nr:hypothetical protein [Tamilnaduibacter salinus]
MPESVHLLAKLFQRLLSQCLFALGRFPLSTLTPKLTFQLVPLGTTV